MISSQKMFFNGSDYCLHGELLKRIIYIEISPFQFALSRLHIRIFASQSPSEVYLQLSEQSNG